MLLLCYRRKQRMLKQYLWVEAQVLCHDRASSSAVCTALLSNGTNAGAEIALAFMGCTSLQDGAIAGAHMIAGGWINETCGKSWHWHLL